MKEIKKEIGANALRSRTEYPGLDSHSLTHPREKSRKKFRLLTAF